MATEHTLFELNFERYLWKEDLTVKIELPKLENFLEELETSWEAVKKLIEITKEAIKRQFESTLKEVKLEKIYIL